MTLDLKFRPKRLNAFSAGSGYPATPSPPGPARGATPVQLPGEAYELDGLAPRLEPGYRPGGRPAVRAAGLALALLLGGLVPARSSADPVTVGYRDFNYGTTVTRAPTGEKPESKLWWNDGIWWGSLWDTTSSRYEIHRFDPAAQNWSSTDTPIDDRLSTKADALWDGEHLYIASHVFTTNPGSTSAADAGRLYRFSYDPVSDRYTPDPGYPVNVNDSSSEALVLDKDSTGKLWVTWVENGMVKVNRTLGDDRKWGAPFNLPVQGTDTDLDDISSVISFGDRVGVMWSNQLDQRTYFAVHIDANPRAVWEPREIALADSTLGAMSDDHLSLKTHEGTVYAVTKTSLGTSTSPLVLVLRRAAGGAWSRHLFGTVHENHTRPVLLIDADRDSVHVVAASNRTGKNVIYMKSASLTDLVFPEGLGMPLIDSPFDLEVNNPTSTKQALTRTTGLLVLASDEDTRHYLHNYLPWLPAPRITFFTPASGAVGTVVEIHGSGFTGATAVAFNATPASFSVEADTLIRATVPAGATSGPVSVTNPAGSAVSSAEFVVTGGTTDVGTEGPGAARTLALHLSRPNPFREATRIRFELPLPGRARLGIYDLEGRLIRRLLDARLPAGVHGLAWDGRDEVGRPVPSGLYLARLVVGGSEARRKLLRVR